jgi:hypothetical protein
LGNPEGPHALACELVGNILADWLGLSTFDFAIVEVSDDDEIPFLKGGLVNPGPAFISRAEPKGYPWGGSPAEIRAVVNKDEISGLVVMDTWALNSDRHSPDGRRVNRDNVFLIQCNARRVQTRLIAMDFTHAFRLQGEVNRRVAHIERCRDERVYGRFPEFTQYLDREQVRRYSARLSSFSRSEAERIIALVPFAWDVNRESRSAWAKLITDRAQFLADHIESILWPQLELEGGTE